MKLRTLARISLNYIEDGTFLFDNDMRKDEAIRQLKRIIHGKCTEKNNSDDPICELHISVYKPNINFPIVPLDMWGNIVVWHEDGKYMIPGYGTHVVKGVSVTNKEYFMGYVHSLFTYKDAILKVDKYTDLKRAAYALTCSVSQILNKKDFRGIPLKMESEIIHQTYQKKDEVFEKQQKSLYIKWLMKWIEIHKKNPDTHMKFLKKPKKKLF